MHYLIGDLQGCCDALARLLEKIDFSPSRDRLYLLGDLVNRGPDSLTTLRRLQSLGDAAQCLLGNHDLHLLATAAGVRAPHKGDTLDAILQAPHGGAPDRVRTLVDAGAGAAAGPAGAGHRLRLGRRADGRPRRGRRSAGDHPGGVRAGEEARRGLSRLPSEASRRAYNARLPPGDVAEWFKAAVLKTAEGSRPP